MSSSILIIGNSNSDFSIDNSLSKYSVLYSDNANDAIKQIKTNSDIGLIIIDTDVSGAEGLNVLSYLKSNILYNKIRAIAITNPARPEQETIAIKMGACDYLRKPVDEILLKTRIEMHFFLLHQTESDDNDKALIFNSIFQQAPIGIAISYNSEPGSSNEYFNVNSMFEKIIGRSKEELKKVGWAKITHPDDLEEDLKNFRAFMAGDIDSYTMEKRFIRPDGSAVWVNMHVATLNYLNRDKYSHICLIQEITNRKAIEQSLKESERSKSVLLSNLPGLAYRCNLDKDWTMQFVSDGCYELTGYHPEALLHNKHISFNDIIAPEYQDILWAKWTYIVENKLSLKYEYEIITAGGERKWVLEMGEPIYDKQGKVEALEGIIIDITERKKIENELKYNTEHDRLTGLYNRKYLENILKSDLESDSSQKRALVGINISSLQSLTASYGYHYTQEVIKKIADALIKFSTENRLLFCTYESRFAFYFKEYKNKKELTDFCKPIISILESLLKLERIGGGIGVIEIDKNSGEVDNILKKLLIASERAMEKENDFDYCFFDSDMEAKIDREEYIKNQLVNIASNKGEGLFLLFQPVLNLKTNKICGFEALARLNTEKYGLISPMEFIPIAEKTKLIIPIGEKIIYQSFSFLNMLNKSGYNDISVSINVSAIQLLKNDFSDKLLDLIEKMRVSSKNICLEITESVFSADYKEINSIIKRLKEARIHIAIDDFGTGYSSLARERELNVNCIKIDKHFVDKLLKLKPDEAITEDIISMAHKLGHYVVAEGVEVDMQRQYLLASGCDKIQGYLISKPIDEKAAIDFLDKYNN